MEKFDKTWLTKLWRPSDQDNKFGAGQVTIIGGSSLFHGAPILALKAASRIVSMVYFASPEMDKGVAEKIKSTLSSFIWIPRDEVNEYVAKSDAVLVGPGMMRNHYEKDGFACDEEGRLSKEITLATFLAYPSLKYVVDGGALQVIGAADLPKGCVITPNRKEFEMLFKEKIPDDFPQAVEVLKKVAKEHNLVVVHKAATGVVTDGERVVLIEGGNPGLVKGGVGDIVSGLTVGFLAKNDPLLSAAAAVYLTKKAADGLYARFGYLYNSDDVVEEARRIFGEEMK